MNNRASITLRSRFSQFSPAYFLGQFFPALTWVRSQLPLFLNARHHRALLNTHVHFLGAKTQSHTRKWPLDTKTR